MAQEASVFPIVIDSRPAYLQECRATLLRMPLADGTVLSHIAEKLQAVTVHRPRVVRAFEADPAYDDELRATGLIREPSIHEREFRAILQKHEPSDWLLFVDPRCFPVDGFNPLPILRKLDEAPRLARHLIAMAATADGTNERVEFDSLQRVRCVQRYYESVTWAVALGVSCSLVPVSALLSLPALPLGALADLRRALAATAHPSRDIPIAGAVVDLGIEQSLLLLNEGGIGTDPERPRSASGILRSSARLIGRVIVHEGAEIGERATVIGPTVIGARARIGTAAVVAQCVVAPGVAVADGATARHRVVTASTPVPALEAYSPDPELDEGQLPIRDEDSATRMYPVVKRGVEAVIAIVALLFLSPLLALVAALVKLDSEGPIFYGDPREARGGRLFHCYKFRTMRVNAHSAQRELESANQVDGPQFKIRNDPRVTRVGGWLRRSNLDELPQLFNVAIGHMSLVGPRPSPFRENQTCVPWREARLSVRPGITGLWQVCRHDRQEGDFHQWIYYDIEYVRHMSFWVDFKIVLATIITLGGKGYVPLAWIVSPHAKELA